MCARRPLPVGVRFGKNLSHTPGETPAPTTGGRGTLPAVPGVAAIAANHSELQRWRRDIHAHPELGFQEHRTADFVAAKLREFGLDVHTGIGGTGVVGVLQNGNETRTVGLRADMDALPIREENTFAHRSTHDGTMHACGHDGHTTMLLGAAQYLAKTRNFRGRVHFIFQPAEEGLGGAKAMVDDGLFTHFPCDSIFAMHNAPGMPLGRFGVRAGVVAAAGAFFDIDIRGRGGHGAHPHLTVDPIVVAAQLISALQSVVARNVSPTETAVLSVTMVRGGDAYNVIPASARLSGTVRAFTKAVLARVEERITDLAHAVAGAFGADADVQLRTTFHPVVNAADATAVADAVCTELVGTEQVRRDYTPSTGSEDFSFMLEEVPGCYLLIGNGDGETSRPVHHPGYDFNDDALTLGASFFARVVERQLAG